jgi:probable HAF family extracellular repeat protein
MVDIGVLPGAIGSSANAINNLGDVVGFSGGNAFLYTGGTMLNLNDLVDLPTGTILTSGVAINDAGQILAGAYDQFGSHYVLLSPVPEPASAALILSGALVLVRRRPR